MQISAGMYMTRLGDHSGAVRTLTEGLDTAQRLENHLMAAYARHYLLEALAASSDPTHRRQAQALAHQWVDGEDSPPSRRGVGYAFVAQVLALHGEWTQAESFAREACELLASVPLFQVFARGVLSSTLLSGKRVAEARRIAQLGVEQLQRMGGSKNWNAVPL